MQEIRMDWDAASNRFTWATDLRIPGDCRGSFTATAALFTAATPAASAGATSAATAFTIARH
jgi:hypothetical protein